MVPQVLVDVHSHFFSRKAAQKVIPDTKSKGLKLHVNSSRHLTVKIGPSTRGPMRSGVYDLNDRVRDRNHRKIELEVLSPLPMFLASESVRFATRFLRAQNKEIARITSEDPSRLAGLGAVPLQDVRAAIDMIDEIRSLGLRGVEIGTSVNGLLLDDKRFADFFAQLNASGVIPMSLIRWEMTGLDDGVPARTSN